MKNSTFSNSNKRRIKNYRHPRVRRVAQRNSVISLITDYIDKQGLGRKNNRVQSELEDGVYFQIFGMLIITVAVVLFFQGFINSSPVSTSAAQTEDSVRLLTNFQYIPEDAKTESRLQDFSIVPVSVPTEEIITAPANESEVVQPVIHVVVAGDSVYSLSTQYQVSVDQIIDNNNLSEPYSLDIGDEIVIE